MLDHFFTVFQNSKNKEAVIWKDRSFTYNWLLKRISFWGKVLKTNQIKPGTISILESDFSPNSVALLLSLIENQCVLVPLTKSVQAKKSDFIEIAQGEVLFKLDEYDNFEITRFRRSADHKYYEKLRDLHHAGLVLFSSGSTGKSKASVHDLAKLLEKFKVPRHSMRTITFLLYDHIGGINTMLYTLSNAGCIITVQSRSPDDVFHAIEKHKAELLPTSPTFLNLIILSETYEKYDISSLKVITYGTESMTENTLRRAHEIFPNIKLQQTYGLSELGILRSKSKESDSLWVKIGGEGYETKIVDDVLWIRAESSMLGYLNAPYPFDAEGWLNTGDVVEMDGEYIRILGRKSEIINVGGEKVFPVEVESVLQMMEGVEDATVSGESNPIVGQIVKARVKLNTEESLSEFRKRMHAFSRDRLPKYKIPQKVEIVTSGMHGDRFKKLRQA